MTDTFEEYAIEVEGVGWLIQAYPHSRVAKEDPAVVSTSANEASVIASDLERTYDSLGQPDIADKVKVRVRTVTLSRSEWRHNP